MRTGIVIGTLSLLLPFLATNDAGAQCGHQRFVHHRGHHVVYDPPILAVPLVQATYIAVPVPGFGFQFDDQHNVVTNGTGTPFTSQVPTINPLSLNRYAPNQFQPNGVPRLGYQQQQANGFAGWRTQVPQYHPQQQQAIPDLPVAVESAEVAVSLEREQIEAAGHSILRQECKSCHTYPGKTTPSGVQVWMYDAQGNFSPSVDNLELWASIANGRMPKAGAADPSKLIGGERKEILRRMLTTGTTTALGR